MRSGLRWIKPLIWSTDKKPGTIRLGIFRGIKTLAIPAESLQIRLGLWERETYKYISQAAAVADWVIDIGAGDGELSLFFSLRTKARPILAIEPWDSGAVTANIALNGADGISVISDLLGTGDNQTPLDHLSVPRDKTGFIKLDADFEEIKILKSGRQLLADAKPYLLIETHSADLERDCLSFLAGLGYACTIIPNAWWRTIIPDLRPIPHNRWLWAVPAGKEGP